jgi:Rrf2 family transcriptional regulator, nitric oxide-sensitive transcriptional repressor
VIALPMQSLPVAHKAVGAHTFNVEAIVRIMEDMNNFVECFDPTTNSCSVTPVCGLRHTLAGALEVFARHLVRYTIMDLIPNAERVGPHLDMPRVEAPR